MIRDIRAIRRLTPLLGVYPWSIPALILLGILSSLSEGFGISLLIPFLQSVIQNTQTSGSNNSFVAFLDRIFVPVPPDYRLIVIPVCILLSVLLKNIVLYINRSLFAWLNAQISHRLRSDTFRQWMSVSVSYLDKQESGRLLNIMASETWQTSRALETLVNLMICICTIAVFAVLLFFISWQLTLLVGVAAFLISCIVRWVTRQIEGIGQQAVQSNAALSIRMCEGLSGMKTIRAFGHEAYEQQQFDQASDRVRHIFTRLAIFSGSVNPLYETLSALLVIGILIIALTHNQSTLPSLLTFLFILYRLQPQFQLLDHYRVTLLSLASSVQEVMSFLDRTDKPYLSLGHLPFHGLQQGIEFRSVSFQYDQGDRLALQDVSIRLPRGQMTALVGTSGAGKSTLVSLICRFYDPSSGEIYIDGLPLKQLNLQDWRNCIAIVSQDVHVFSATIRENIAYGNLEATEADIIAAAKKANAHEFIGQLPQGYDTPIGDRGVRLSGGQRQRIALARAIIRDPEILILDEATNALDTLSEHLIQTALDAFSRNRTVIVIAHRLSTIERADQILVLEDGNVVEQGNLDTLLLQNGLFAQLYQLQYGHALPHR